LDRDIDASRVGRLRRPWPATRSSVPLWLSSSWIFGIVRAFVVPAAW